VVDKLTLMGSADLLNPPPSDDPTLGDQLNPNFWLGTDWFGAPWFAPEQWAWLSPDALKADALALFGVEEARRNLILQDPQSKFAMAQFGEAQRLTELARNTPRSGGR